jgi:hypothetical protein
MSLRQEILSNAREKKFKCSKGRWGSQSLERGKEEIVYRERTLPNELGNFGIFRVLFRVRLDEWLG